MGVQSRHTFLLRHGSPEVRLNEMSFGMDAIEARATKEGRNVQLASWLPSCSRATRCFVGGAERFVDHVAIEASGEQDPEPDIA
jgi:hypothetical protein